MVQEVYPLQGHSGNGSPIEKVAKVTHLLEEVERYGGNCCVGGLLMTTTLLPPPIGPPQGEGGGGGLLCQENPAAVEELPTSVGVSTAGFVCLGRRFPDCSPRGL